MASDEDHISAFGGMAGRVAWLALNPLNLVMGVLLGIAFFVTGWVLGAANAMALATPLSQVMMALLLARYAVNGRAGEWWGTFFSCHGGPWIDVLPVAARYLALTAAWLLPLVAFGLRPEALVGLASGLGGGKIVALVSLYFLGMVFTPPVFLVVSLRASSFAEAFTPEHWRSSFAGRLGDLFVLYAVAIGGGSVALLLLVPSVLAAGASSPKLMLVLGGLGLCYLGAYGTDMIGRLSGLFAADEAEPQPAREPAPARTGASPSSWPRSGGVPSRPPASVASVGDTPVAVASAPGVASAATNGAVPPLAPPPAAVGLASGKVILLSAREQVDAAWARFRSEAPAAIAQLEELRRSYAPHPHVLQALALMRAQTGDQSGALAVAREAVPLCLQRGHLQLVAQIYRALPRQVKELGLDREQVLLVAHSLQEMRDLRGAANAYAAVLALDAGESRALKGTLAVADAMLREPDGAEGARRLYRYLLERAPTSPFAEYARRGLESAERRLTRTTA